MTVAAGARSRSDQRVASRFRNLASPLVIDGQSFTLVNSLPALASAVAANKSGSFALANSYDASQHGTYSHSPIKVVDGTIEGLGNTISHLEIVVEHRHRTAMVGVVDATGAIETLSLASIHVRVHGGIIVGSWRARTTDFYLVTSLRVVFSGSGRGIGVGGLVDVNFGTGIIISASANVRTKADHPDAGAGGLVNLNYGAIERSSAHCSGTCDGGLVGQNLGPLSEDFSTGVGAGGLRW